jgi:hypothetical protein
MQGSARPPGKAKRKSKSMASNQGWTSEESFDWDAVSTEPPPPLEVGIYKAIVVKAEPSPTKDNKPSLKIELSVIETFGAGPLESPRKMFDNVTFVKEAAFRVKQLATAAGVTPPPTSKFADVEAFAQALVESNCVYLRSKRDTYQGKTNAKVDRYLSEAQAGEAANGSAATPSADAPARPTRTRKAAAG